MRLILGGVVAALALAVVPAANAAPALKCAPDFEIVCTVICRKPTYC